MKGGEYEFVEIKKLSLKQARVLSNLTQEQAAKKIGVSTSTISNWEKGFSYPDAKEIKLIEKIYGLPYDMILFL